MVHKDKWYLVYLFYLISLQFLLEAKFFSMNAV